MAMFFLTKGDDGESNIFIFHPRRRSVRYLSGPAVSNLSYFAVVEYVNTHYYGPEIGWATNGIEVIDLQHPDHVDLRARVLRDPISGFEVPHRNELWGRIPYEEWRTEIFPSGVIHILKDGRFTMLEGVTRVNISVKSVQADEEFVYKRDRIGDLLSLAEIRTRARMKQGQTIEITWSDNFTRLFTPRNPHGWNK